MAVGDISAAIARRSRRVSASLGAKARTRARARRETARALGATTRSVVRAAALKEAVTNAVEKDEDAVDVAARLLEPRKVSTWNRFDALSEDDDVIPIMSVDRQSIPRG